MPETLQELVGRHLLAAEVALSEDDMKTALEHSRQAKKLAGRVAVVREANGTMEYLAGEYAAALNELRAVRRMTGSNDFVAMIAKSSHTIHFLRQSCKTTALTKTEKGSREPEFL